MVIPSRRLRIAALFLFAAAAIALPQETKPGASVSGRVMNSATKKPVGHAHVILHGARQPFGALTDTDGKFSISTLPGGDYSLSVDAPGFQPLPGSWDSSLNRLKLRAGEHKNNLEIKLTPSGAISGRVLDADGKPLQGLALSVESIEGVIEGSPSDPDGSYRIGNLPPGKYRVLAEPDAIGNLAPEIRTDNTKEVHYSATYYPASVTIQSAGRIDIPPGTERTGIDIHMVRTPIVAVRGTVSGIPASVSRVLITVRKLEPPIREGKSVRRMFADTRPVNPDGSFVIWRLDPGTYVLIAQGNPEVWMSPPLKIAVSDKDIDGVALHLVPPSDISGQLKYADPAARLPKIPANASLSETPQFSMEGLQGYAHAFSFIAADGFFHVDRVSPDQYSVGVSAGYL